MLDEVFYKFLMMIKRVKTDIKFIISGDYNQFLPVNDRISQRTDYANSPCLFELADYNKIQLTKCRRADDTLYNLVKFDNVPKLKPSDFTETNEYTNAINLYIISIMILKAFWYAMKSKSLSDTTPAIKKCFGESGLHEFNKKALVIIMSDSDAAFKGND
jgi:hypothetical protein